MMKFSQRSLNSLKGVDSRLVYLMAYSIATTPIDFTIIEGFRDLKTQSEYLKNGSSKTLNSKHLRGLAVDIYPYPIPQDLKNPGIEYKEKQVKLAEHISKVAQELKINIMWGGHWSFGDVPHFELI